VNARPATLGGRLWRALAAEARRIAADSESGQGLVEFVIVFPVQLFVILAIMQFALLCVGHLVVQHAAFVAARAALVADTMVSDASNPTGSPGMSARVAAEEAARIVCAAVTQEEDAEPIPAPRSWRTDSINRANTTAMRVTVSVEEQYVGAVVEYDFQLFIPVARFLFADGPRSYQVLRKAAYLAKPWKGN
jgi:Flp pilus assembly protein TadG